MRARRFPTILFLTIWAIAAGGCIFYETIESTQVPQSKIRQTYVVTASREGAFVTASFAHESEMKNILLQPPSRIEHNGAPLAKKTIFLGGPLYEKRLPGLHAVHSFVYTNNDRDVFRNELSFEPIEISGDEAVVARRRETRFPLSRRVREGETMTVSLESAQKPADNENSNAADKKAPAEEYSLTLNDELEENRSVIVLKPKNLKRFAPGAAVLKIEVSRTLDLQQAPAGGTMTWRYNSTRNVRVTD